MASPYYFRDSEDNQFIEIADGDFFTGDMPTGTSLGQCAVQFYDAQKAPVTPTAGTVTFKSAMFSGQWLEPNNGNGVINAVDVIAGDANYTPAQFNGPVIKSRMTLSGITGAVYVRAYHWRDE